jgi:MoaA/NifB/PqqE/SkfB family radical SAM enzyme
MEARIELNRPSAPLFATINITGICNLSCGYCFYQPRAQNVMTLDNFKKAVTELSGLSVFFLNISGGEPFTHPKISTFLQLAHDKFKHVVTLTNGTILTPAHVRTIKSIVRKKGGFPIQVSLDAVASGINAKTRTGSEKILANLAKLKDAGADIVIAMVISRFNSKHLIDSIINLSAITKFFHIMPFQSVLSKNGTDTDCAVTENELTKIWAQIRKIKKNMGLRIDIPSDGADKNIGCAQGAPCMAAFSQIVIDPNLKIRPCDRLVDAFIGDLSKSTVSEVWKSKESVNVFKQQIPFCKIQ